jgi:hypothetical protein
LLSIAVAGAFAACTSLSGLTGGDVDSGRDHGDAGVAHDAGADGARLSLDGGMASDGSIDAGSLYRRAVLTDKPIAYWRLGEAVGAATAADETGHFPGGYNSCALDQTGALAHDTNTAARFDGTTSIVTVYNGTGLDFPGTQSFTVEAWIKPSKIDSTNRPVYVRETSDDKGLEGYGLVIEENSGIGLERFVSGDRVYALAPSPDAGVYTYVVGTYDGEELTVYINGMHAGSTGDTRPMPSTPAVPNIGGYSEDTSYAAPFEGTLDEVAVYDAALPSTHVMIHYLTGIGEE